MSEPAEGTGAPNPQAGDLKQGDGGAPAGEGKTTEGEGAPQGETKPEGGGKGKESTEVDYTFEFPEGIEVNEAELNDFKAAAKELKLDADGAKKLVALRTKYAQAQAEAHTEMVEKWAADATTDKEYGGDKFQENLGIANKALETFGSPELREFLKTTRLGNHPELVRLMYRIGKGISEDKFVKPGATTGANKSAADVIYGTN